MHSFVSPAKHIDLSRAWAGLGLISQRRAQTQTIMPKKPIPADELIWLFHEKLAGTAVPSATIAIVPGGNNWTALTNAADCRRHPELATTVARIQKQLRSRYSLKSV